MILGLVLKQSCLEEVPRVLLLNFPAMVMGLKKWNSKSWLLIWFKLCVLPVSNSLFSLLSHLQKNTPSVSAVYSHQSWTATKF